MPDMNDVQGELMDMIIADKSPSQISDRIKDMLFAKTADKVDSLKPEIAASLFGNNEVEVEEPEETIEQPEATTDTEDQE